MKIPEPRAGDGAHRGQEKGGCHSGITLREAVVTLSNGREISLARKGERALGVPGALLDEPLPQRVGDRLGAVPAVELVQDVADVRLHRALGDPKLGGDLAAGISFKIYPAAPASMAASALVSSRRSVMMMISTAGMACLMARVASIPSTLGRSWSIKTTAGSRRRVSWTASSPLVASPTISMSPVAWRSTDLTPSRNSPQSSASKTLVIGMKPVLPPQLPYTYGRGQIELPQGPHRPPAQGG